MKNYFYLFLLLPFLSFSKFYSGKITMKDNSIKIGFIELPDDSTNKNVKFRTTEKGKTEKIENEKIQFFTIINDSKETKKFSMIYLANFKIFSKTNEIKVDKEISCVRVIKEGKINLYYAWFASAGYGALGTAIKNETGMYYVNKPNENFAIILYDLNPVNWFSFLKTNVEKIFAKDCPSLHEKLDKKVIKEKGIISFVELYEQNCGN